MRELGSGSQGALAQTLTPAHVLGDTWGHLGMCCCFPVPQSPYLQNTRDLQGWVKARRKGSASPLRGTASCKFTLDSETEEQQPREHWG